MVKTGTLPFNPAENNQTHYLTNSIAVSTSNSRLWVLKANTNQAAYSDNGGASWNSVTLPVLTWSRFCYSRYFGKFFYLIRNKSDGTTNDKLGLYEASSYVGNFSFKKDITMKTTETNNGFEGPIVCAGPYIISCDDSGIIGKYDYAEDNEFGVIFSRGSTDSLYVLGMTFGDGRVFILDLYGNVHSFHPDLLDWKFHPKSSSGYTIQVIGNSTRSSTVTASYTGAHNFGETTFTVNASDWKRYKNTGAYYVDIKTKFINLIKADISYQKPVVSGGKFTPKKKGTLFITVEGKKNPTWKKVVSNSGKQFMFAKYINGNFFVTAFSPGMLYISLDGVNWSSQKLHDTEALYGIAFGRGVYAVSGNGAGVWRCTNENLNSWQLINDKVGISDWIGDIEYGNGHFVRVGRSLANGEFGVSYSPNAINWYKGRADYTGIKDQIKFMNNYYHK